MGYSEHAWLREHDLMEMDVCKDTSAYSVRITEMGSIILVSFNVSSFTLVSCLCKYTKFNTICSFLTFLCLRIILSATILQTRLKSSLGFSCCTLSPPVPAF